MGTVIHVSTECETAAQHGKGNWEMGKWGMGNGEWERESEKVERWKGGLTVARYISTQSGWWPSPQLPSPAADELEMMIVDPNRTGLCFTLAFLSCRDSESSIPDEGTNYILVRTDLSFWAVADASGANRLGAFYLVRDSEDCPRVCSS